MAFNRRKLHPGAPASDDVWICERYCGEALGEGEDCSSLCLKKCPSLCSDTSIRPLPFPPIPAPFAQNKHGGKFSLPVIIIIIIIAVLVSLLLLVSCYKIVVKILSNRNTSRRTPPAESDDTDDDFLDDNQDPLANNPVWFINSVGLQRSIINSITVCKYKRGEGLIEGTDCSVCLSEFREDETLRLLPKCSHAFHIPCIDTWLRSHKNCPLCRAPIVSYTDERFLAPSEPNFNGSSSREETQMETFESGNGGLISDQREENGFNNPRTGDDNEGENPRTDAEISKVNLPSSFVNCRNRVLSDLDDNYRVLEDEIQPFRRSVSMNSSLPSMMSRCV